MREAIGRKPQGAGHDKAWGVMDLLAVTDFPDIRFKATIQSGSGGNILLIPREGGYLVRLYVDMGEIAADAWLTPDDILDQARSVLAPYTLEVKEIAWFSVYRVGHRVTDKFDDVDDDKVGTRSPRVFIAGDACHTHTAKAGQGMNVSMQDTFNLGWKLAAVLQGRSPAALLDTYSQERKQIAEDLIAMDTRWSQAIGGAGRVDSDDPREAMAGFAEVQRQFVTNGEFTAGLATHYPPGLLTGDDAHLHLAPGYPPGRRFKSAEVIRLGDAKRVHLGHVHRADGRWRLYAFADAVDPRTRGSRFLDLMDFLAGDDSPIRRYTPEGLRRRRGLRRPRDHPAVPPGRRLGRHARLPQAAQGQARSRRLREGVHTGRRTSTRTSSTCAVSTAEPAPSWSCDPTSTSPWCCRSTATTS